MTSNTNITQVFLLLIIFYFKHRFFLMINITMIDISTNPLYYAAIGGVILGVGTSLNYCLRGKVTGMSGILFGIVSCKRKDIPENISILGGMLAASGLFFDVFAYGTSNQFTPFGPAASITALTSYVGYALAGLLVGFGTKLGNGCTSGHGLCGLPRFSIRSFVAVGVFLCSAIAVATLASHETLGPFTNQELNPQLEYNHQVSANFCLALGMLLPILGGVLRLKGAKSQQTCSGVAVDQLITFGVGLIFGCGLLVSGMVRRVNIISFLSINYGWNPSLLFVLGCGVGVNLITFNYMLRVKKQSLMGKQLFNPNNKTIDKKLILGALSFGVGWGIGGLCPGPAIMQFSIFTLQISVVWFTCLVIGMLIAARLQDHWQKQVKPKKHHILKASSIVEANELPQNPQFDQATGSKVVNAIQ